MLNSRDCSNFRFNRRLIRQAARICFLAATPFQAWAQDVSSAHLQSGKYRALEAWRNRVVALSSVTGAHDTLAGYAAKCDAATGIHVPGFTCGNGVEPPGQGTQPEGTVPRPRCDHPNVLNGACDPGSRFQVLPGGTADAVAVAHCRKNGKPIEGNVYNDIAVIQYNKKKWRLVFLSGVDRTPRGRDSRSRRTAKRGRFRRGGHRRRQLARRPASLADPRGHREDRVHPVATTTGASSVRSTWRNSEPPRTLFRTSRPASITSTLPPVTSGSISRAIAAGR